MVQSVNKQLKIHKNISYGITVSSERDNDNRIQRSTGNLAQFGWLAQVLFLRSVI